MAATKRSRFIGFFKDIFQELKKVTWPTREQLIKNTVTVLTVCAIIGLIIWMFDWGLSALVNAVLK
ncbi:MAG TPA: preprotein translocase subunit SecE [Clostridia bacterium]|jgi:preprotein translocase subunit SecE|nr:preprotein translocase subunit SecE [Clostridia bacterium]HPQ47375.1 preprotein translocase subunit SecE [Clostridia bacterium]HRX42173.1 preprotein translocase subunit SecE [Clostridia bacterium]